MVLTVAQWLDARAVIELVLHGVEIEGAEVRRGPRHDAALLEDLDAHAVAFMQPAPREIDDILCGASRGCSKTRMSESRARPRVSSAVTRRGEEAPRVRHFAARCVGRHRRQVTGRYCGLYSR
jgi:hypothetical protein